MKLNNFNDIMKKTFGDRYVNVQSDPTEFNGKENKRCSRCDNDILTPEEIEEKMCLDCMEELEIQDENSNSRNLANER